jgi:PAS domain S-box-containing protein
VSKDYDQLSRAELLERLRALEEAARAKGGGAALETAARSLHPATSALYDSEERLRAILETAVEGIVTIDDRGIIESLNPAAEKIFGFRGSELRGKNVSVLMPPPYRQEHDAYLARYLATGQARIIGIGREVVGQRKDGTVFPMDLSVSEVRLAGGQRLFTGFVRDITERKRAEKQLADLAQTLAEKNKELETIVYVASHDLRSPLVNIQGFSTELDRACQRLQARLSDGTAATAQPGDGEVRALLKEEIPEALEYIRAGVAKIDTLLAGFLRYSRLGRAALNIKPLNLNAMLAGIVQAMEFQIHQAGVSLQVGDLPGCLGDETQINQVFSNLLDNAVKYLRPGVPGQIRISGTLSEGRSVYAVADNGIGIAPEHQAKIFEIFHRLNPSEGQGEGLGLTIAQRILERNNGRIWVESKPSEGTTFLVSLPSAP